MRSDWKTANARKLNSASRKAASELVQSQRTWELLITMTFRYNIAEDKANEKFLFYFKQISQRLRSHLHIAFVLGRQKNGRLHFHVLLSADEELGRQLEISDTYGISWPGHIRAEYPQNQKKICDYIMHAGHHYWDINVVCPKPAPCKRRNCKL